MIRTAKTKAAAHSRAKTPTARRTAVAAASGAQIAPAGVAEPAAIPIECGRQASEQAVSPHAPAVAPPAKVVKRPSGKLGALVALLQADAGTTIEAMMEATGWQTHSVRGAISGSLKKKLGFEVLSEKTKAGRIFRIASAAKEPQS